MDDVTRKPAPPRPAPPQTQVPPATPEPSPSEFVHKLLKPIKAHGEEITELKFREPTGGDIVNFGNPVRLDLYMDNGAMEAQMSALAAVPPSTIRQLKARDWNTIAFELLARFFAPALGGSG